MFSDETRLSLRIRERRVYADEYSREKKTNVVKRKYKLFCSKLESLGIYLFFVADGDYFHCDKDLMIWVRPEDWEEREKGYLEGISYFDLRKSESLTGDEIISKIDDSKNQFMSVAQLPKAKYDQMKVIMRGVEGREGIFGKRKNTIPLLIEGLLKEEVSQGLLEKLGLN